MRNTYIQLTEKGEELFLTIFKDYEPLQNPVFKGAIPFHHLYGKFPDFIEMMTIVRSIYGADFMESFEFSECPFDNIEKIRSRVRKD